MNVFLVMKDDTCQKYVGLYTIYVVAHIQLKHVNSISTLKHMSSISNYISAIVI